MDDIKPEMRKIKDDLLEDKSLPLYEFRVSENNFPVIGEGSHDAKILFIGEAPGKNEAKTGRPFVGRAGKILDELLSSAGISRNEVYITNIVKDRPPENRDPSEEEIKSYGPYLDRQLEVIRPKVIAPLGRFSMKYILDKFNCIENELPISQLHGRVIDTDAPYGAIKIVPLYHPAVAIYTQSKKPELLKDFGVLKALI
ncbi:MAG: uracil-DNA glycosylase [Minisyncoccia bacterium]